MAEATYEEKLTRLTAIVEELEKGDAALERGVELYKEGLALARECSERLEAAKNDVRLVGRELLTTFDQSEGSGDGK